MLVMPLFANSIMKLDLMMRNTFSLNAMLPLTGSDVCIANVIKNGIRQLRAISHLFCSYSISLFFPDISQFVEHQFTSSLLHFLLVSGQLTLFTLEFFFFIIGIVIFKTKSVYIKTTI